jgi:hypothetical protein
MPTYSDTRTFPETNKVFSDFINPALTVIQAGGGSVAIEVDLGNSTFIPIPGSPFSTDTAFHLNISNGRFRFTPTGGAVYGFNVRG